MKKTIELDGQTYRLVPVKPRKKRCNNPLGPERKTERAAYMKVWRLKRKNEIDALYARERARLAESASAVAPAATVTEIAEPPCVRTE